MKDTNTLFLFTDGSVNTKFSFGYGAYLAVNEALIQIGNLEQLVKIKRFEGTSSVKLELQTLLWALTEVKNFEGKIILHTDSQNITGLPRRRERLEKNEYYSKQNRRIANWELYKEFYQLTDQLKFEMQKVTGHKKTSSKDYIDRLFTLVDRASRKALRGAYERNIQN